MIFQRLPASDGADAIAVAGSATVSRVTPDVPTPSIGHNCPSTKVRRTSVTLHFEMHEDGQIHVRSDDMPYLILSDSNCRALMQDVSGALSYEIRRRFLR